MPKMAPAELLEAAHKQAERTTRVDLLDYVDGQLAAVGNEQHEAAESTLLRVAAERKQLQLHRPEPGQHPDFCGYDKHEMPCPSLRLLAEGWGWGVD